MNTLKKVIFASICVAFLAVKWTAPRFEAGKRRTISGSLHEPVGGLAHNVCILYPIVLQRTEWEGMTLSKFMHVKRKRG